MIVFGAGLALAILARGAAAAALAAGRRCMGSRNTKILVALVVLCVVGGRRLRRGRGAGPERDDHRRAAAGRGRAGPQRPDGARGRTEEADPQRPRLRRRRRQGQAAAGRPQPASGSTSPPATASAWASLPRASTTPPTVFNSKMQALNTRSPLTGLPSRARVSEDGRYGAMTVFVTGDSYLESSTAFSTRTYVVDMASGKAGRPARAVQGRPRTASPSTRSTSTSGASPSTRATPIASTRPWAPATHHYLVEGSISGER